MQLNNVIFSLIFFIAFYLSFDNPTSVQIFSNNENSIKFEKNEKISIVFVGDMMCHSPQFKNAYNDSLGLYDFSLSFQFVKSIIESADIAFGNLETVLSRKEEKFSGYPLFNSPDEYLFAIKNSGFDIINIANNHILDRGLKGVLKTSKLIDSLGLIRIGAYLDVFDRDSIRLIDVKNFKVAFLGYTEHTNGNKIKDKIINYTLDTLIKHDIRKAKDSGAELIITYFHFGEEYKRAPNTFQKKIVDSTFQFGADLIICSHPHHVQTFEKRKLVNSNLDTGFVAYSLGNFISNQRDLFKQEGVILKFEFEKIDNKISISQINFEPTYNFIGKYKNKDSHIVLPVNNIDIDSLKSEGFSITEKDVVNINKIINDEIFQIKN